MAWKFFQPDTGAGVLAVTALPSTADDGDEILFMDSLTAPTYTWHLRYLAAKSSNKWLFVGGAGLYAEVTTNEGTTSTSYADLSTTGPSITIPVAGDYFIDHAFTMEQLPSATIYQAMSYDIGATTAVDTDWVLAMATTSAGLGSFARRRKKTGLTAVTLTAKYKAGSAGTVRFSARWIQATPIAIGG